jgi:hypothetical protein
MHDCFLHAPCSTSRPASIAFACGQIVCRHSACRAQQRFQASPSPHTCCPLLPCTHHTNEQFAPAHAWDAMFGLLIHLRSGVLQDASSHAPVVLQGRKHMQGEKYMHRPQQLTAKEPTANNTKACDHSWPGSSRAKLLTHTLWHEMLRCAIGQQQLQA